MFSHHAAAIRIGKNPITPFLFAQSVMLSVLSAESLHELAQTATVKLFPNKSQATANVNLKAH